jgi:type II secretory pathway component GspD/PulD (secretin)
MAGGGPSEGLKLMQDDKDKGLITLIVRDKPLSQVLALLAQTQQLNIVASNDIDVMISITLRKVPVEEALTAVLAVANYTWVKRGNIILITSVADSVNLPADVQGRQIQVFDLDFASATVVKETIDGFLSPIGKASVTKSDHANNRLTQERVVVEDLPASLARIAEYIAQVDQPPRQVLIEAHVLDVKLNDTNNCGVDLSALGLNNVLDTTGAVVAKVPKLAINGFASATQSPAFVATLGSQQLGAVIEILEETTDAKTLGSPKLLVLNEQEARIQVGETLYFKQITTTTTSSQQGAGSVEAGTILRIIPRITRDNRVLLRVSPEVSTPDGQGSDGLPPNILKTTLETDVMLNDNEGMVIGGLINERDSTDQKKIPYLGNVKGIGFLFRHSEVIKERHEIIVTLLTRIQPYDCKYQAYEQGELVRAGVPLLHGPLCRTDRPWDPILPDGKRVAYPLIPPKHTMPPTGYFHDEMPDYVIPPDPLPVQHFCAEGQECAPGGPQPAGPPQPGPVPPDQELPMPDVSGNFSGSTHIISDQPIAVKPKSGMTK